MDRPCTQPFRSRNMMAFLLLGVLNGCMLNNLENTPKTSLFGGFQQGQKPLPLTPPAASTQNLLPGQNSSFPRSNMDASEQRSLNNANSFLPQLNSALKGAPGNNGIAQPMVSSPLLMQRIDQNTWRVASKSNILFQTVAKILSQNYIIAQADRRTLSLSTDWDKFFIDGRLFRNRISINIFPSSMQSSDLIIKNNVEYYNSAATVSNENNQIPWLPTQDITNELDRVLEKTQNQLMALMWKPTMR